MLTPNKLFYALAFLGGSAAVQAAEGHGDVIIGKPGERIDKSGVALRTAEYHYFATYPSPVSGTHNGVQLSQAALRGAFDPRQPTNYIF
ncbi:MAG: hypothetical protein JWP80_3188 [Pseudomonas sp.]|nr:hypothetical protein [Pseudomonas sp.]